MTRTEILVALEEHRITRAVAERLLDANRESRIDDDLMPANLVEAVRVLNADRGDRMGWVR